MVTNTRSSGNVPCWPILFAVVPMITEEIMVQESAHILLRLRKHVFAGLIKIVRHKPQERHLNRIEGIGMEGVYFDGVTAALSDPLSPVIPPSPVIERHGARKMTLLKVSSMRPIVSMKARTHPGKAI